MTHQTKHLPAVPPPAGAGGGTAQTDELLAGILAGVSAEVEIEDYLDAINAGITHDEIMEAAAEHLQIGRYTRARAGDVSHRDILELDRIAYQQRDAHNGVMLNELVAALELGITCEEILAVRGAMANTGSYMDLRAEEAQHSKLMEAVAAGIDLADYAWGWPAASHAQLMQARWLLLNVRLYARLRSAHCGHDEALSRCSRER